MNERNVLRAKLHPVRLTSTESGEMDFPASIRLCPRLCWAAGLAELEQVEVCNLTGPARVSATVLLGEEGEARLPAGMSFGFEAGDQVAIMGVTRVPVRRLPHHAALLVLVDPERNAATEIRRQEARELAREPSFVPTPAPRRFREVRLVP
ncbi:MAG: aspartate 1-decarboxylase [Opitutaceae bacterium]|nr:aspartate 1-decarboxylase [Opitutaceae bacterium]